MSIQRNTLINFAGAATLIVMSLVTVPVYLQTIGEARYGILALVWLFLDYFGFFDLGMGKATANQMASLRDAPTPEREAVFWTGALVNGALGVLGGLVLWWCGYYLLGSYFGAKVSPAMQEEVRAALPWLAVAVPVATLSAVCVAALEARERFLVLNGLQVSTTALFQLLPLAMAWWQGPALDGLIAAAVAARVAASLPLFLACRRYVPLQGLPRFRSALVGTLVRYGGWVTVTALVSPILVSLDRVLIGAQIGPRAVAHYAVPYSLVTKFQLFPASLSRALFPRFSLLDWAASGQLAHEAVLSLVAVITPLIVAGMVVMKPFLSLWVGADLAEVSAPVGEVLLIGVWINCLAVIPFGMLQGQRRPDVVAKFHALELIPYVAVLWMGLEFAGVQGAAWAWVLRVSADAVLLFSAAGLRSRVSPLLWSGLGLLLVLQLGLDVAGDSLVIRASLGVVLLLVAVYWSLRLAPESLRVFLNRFVPFLSVAKQ